MGSQKSGNGYWSEQWHSPPQIFTSGGGGGVVINCLGNPNKESQAVVLKIEWWAYYMYQYGRSPRPVFLKEI